MPKVNGAAAPVAPLTASDVVNSALQLVADLRAQLLEPSATARRACTNAEESIGAFEREATLLGYEIARQRKIAEERYARQTEESARIREAQIEADRRKRTRFVNQSKGTGT